jgi:hypothetical protein
VVLLAVLEGLAVVLVLAGSTSAMGVGRLPPWRLVASGPQVQIDPAALELELVDLALAVVLATSLEGQDFQVAGEVLELGQQCRRTAPSFKLTGRLSRSPTRTPSAVPGGSTPHPPACGLQGPLTSRTWRAGCRSSSTGS